MPRRKIIGWLTAALVMLALFAVAMAPRLSADRFQQPLTQYLEGTLQRPVQVGSLRFTLWGGPGFRIRNLVIADQADLSAEPLAYVSEAHLQLSLASLWRRELLFSRITLLRPSLNLARLPDGRWNYESVLRIPPVSSAGTQDDSEPATRGRLPAIAVESGRVNFRQGLQKSVYYFRNTNLSLAEEDIGTGAWLVEFRAEPARTDSVAPRFGTVRGRGRWRADPAPHGALDLDVALERSPLTELAALFGVPRIGLSGYVSALAHLSGPGNEIRVRGSVELPETADRSPLFGRGSALGIARKGLPLEGTLDLTRRQLALRTAEPVSAGEQVPVPYSAEFLVDPTRPGCPWSGSFVFEELPVESVRELLAYFDDQMPRYPELSGSLRGEMHYRCDEGLQSTVTGDLLSGRLPVPRVCAS
jgi:hypothetical protein